MADYETNWSLAELFPSFESPEFQDAFSALPAQIEEMKNFAEKRLSNTEEVSEDIEQYIRIITSFYQNITRLCDFCELNLSVDAENKTALNCLEKLEDILSETAVPETRFSLFMKAMEEETLQKALKVPYLKEHEFFLREIKANSKYILTEKEESVVSKMENTGSSAWIKYQDNVMATLMVDINMDGEQKKLPFTEIRNLAFDKNPEVRKTAYCAEKNACASVAKACAAALNGIKGEVLTITKLRGYNSPLEMTVIDSRLDMECFEALISSMRKNAGIFIPFFKKKADLLGVDKLTFYDMFAPVGKVDFNYSYDEAVNFVCDNFMGFCEDLGNFAKRAAESKWIDVYPKEGKRGGAFCQNLHYLKQSRFLLNYKGSFNDVLTLAHELGHGYHGECLSGEAYLNSGYPMPIAETASTLCETIVVNNALENAGEGETAAILENGISGSAQVIVDILSRFIFESRLFEARKEGSLSASELCGMMRDAQIEAYGDGLCHDSLHEYMWVVKQHYYSAATNFYNFPYAFGMLFSNALYSRFLEDRKGFAKTYRKMLAATGKMNLRDVALIAGLDICHESFWDSSFDIIKKDIDRFVALRLPQRVAQ